MLASCARSEPVFVIAPHGKGDRLTDFDCSPHDGRVQPDGFGASWSIRAAAENPVDSDAFIIARTDARDVYGLDEALRRGERTPGGADALFIEAPTSLEEMRTIGRRSTCRG
jgi:hypothetical protein